MLTGRPHLALVAIFILCAAINGFGQSQSRLDMLFVPIAWETVDAKGCNARFRLPRGYTSEKRLIDAYGRKLENHAYVWSGDSGQLQVSCGLHPFFVDDRETLAYLYDIDLSSPFRIPTTENLVSKDITVNGHPARQLEFMRSGGKVYLKVWIMLIGDMRFQVSFGTWKDATSPKPKPEALTSIDAFFSSISFTNSVAPISKSYQESLPEGYLGVVEGREYLNHPFGFTLELPTGWSEQSTTWLQKYLENELSSAPVKAYVKRARVLLYSSKGLPGMPSFPAVMIVLEKQPYLNIPPRSLAELNRKTLAHDSSSTIVGEIGEEAIDGRTFSTSTTQKRAGELLVNQISYQTSLGVYSLTFNLQYVDSSQLPEVLKVMRSIRFTPIKRIKGSDG